MSDDDQLLARLGDALERPVPPVAADRVAAVRAAATAAAAGRSAAPIGSSRRTWLLSTAAAAAGAIGGAAITVAVRDDETAMVAGPPTEAMSWTASAPPAPGTPTASAPTITVAGKTINHTWGVELLLDATGFEVGSAYQVMFVGADGARTGAGGFVGAVKPMVCRCNAPVLRDALATMEIVDRDGGVVASGTFA